MVLLGPVVLYLLWSTYWIVVLWTPSNTNLMWDVVITAIKSSLPRQPELYFKPKLDFFSPKMNLFYMHYSFVSGTACMSWTSSNSGVLLINYCIELTSGMDCLEGSESAEFPHAARSRTRPEPLSRGRVWRLNSISRTTCKEFVFAFCLTL